MPLYEYECAKGHRFEAVEKVSERPATRCSLCSAKARRVISRPTLLHNRGIHVFGPAGMLEQEDGENWDQSTRGTAGTVSKRYPLNYSMGLGHGEIIEEELGPPRIITGVNEHAQLWHYRAWAEWMAAGEAPWI